MVTFVLRGHFCILFTRACSLFLHFLHSFGCFISILILRFPFIVSDYVCKHAKSEFGLQLRVDKCEVLLPEESRAAATEGQLQVMLRSCADRGLRVTSRTVSLGVMHGSPADVSEF